MREPKDYDNVVECHYKGAVVYVPSKLFASMTMNVAYNPKKYVRYSEGAKMYGMSLNSFKEFVKQSGALYHPTEKIVLINTRKLDDYLEYFKD